MIGDVARSAEPRRAAFHAVRERAAQPPQPERLAEHIRMHGNVHYQRMALRLRDHLVAAPADGVGDLRRVLVDEAVGAMAGWQAKLVQQVEQAPDADAVAVVAPRVVAMRLRLAGLRRVVAETAAEGEPLDVGGDG